MSNQVKVITKKSENISDWYQDVIQQAKLAEHGPSKGSIIFRPYGYALWEAIQQTMDPMIKKLGGQNAYFPLFIPLSFLQKEQHHVEGFSPELAVVTIGGGEELTEPLVVRPTSETIMYDAYSRWIQSFRDLPLIINQWNNVVRWEKRPYLFLRTTEFLWQEGHGVHASHEESVKLQKDALEMYIDVYKNSLAMYGIAGRKSESEKFAGADTTYTYEILMPDGKVLQGCTSHDLGQNFAKAFNIKYQSAEGKEENPWQNSWGYSTRSLGGLILAHGDDNGLVLPPKIAPFQVIIIPITPKNVDTAEVIKAAEKIKDILEMQNIRTKIDDSDQSPGWKFNQYELQGVPLRIELGARELENGKVKVVRRDNKISQELKIDFPASVVADILDQIQSDMYQRTKEYTDKNTHQADSYDEFKKIMETTRGFIEAFWCEDAECEGKIKEETKATTRCLPFTNVESKGECIYCKKQAKYRWIFAQSY